MSIWLSFSFNFAAAFRMLVEFYGLRDYLLYVLSCVEMLYFYFCILLILFF